MKVRELRRVKEVKRYANRRYGERAAEAAPVGTQAGDLQRFIDDATPFSWVYASNPNDYGTRGIDLHICMPNEVYTRGKVGWGNYFDDWSSDDPYRFMVRSKDITNRRYNSSSPQYHMKMSKNITGCKKAILESLSPITVGDLAKGFKHDVQIHVHHIVNDADSSIRDAVNGFLERGYYEIKRSPKFAEELKHMFKSPTYTFLHPEIKTALGVWIDTIKKHAEVRTNYPETWVFFEGGQFKCLNESTIHPEGNLRKTFTSHEELPQEIHEKLATLNVFGTGHFAEEIGVKLTEELFCVY